MQNKNPILGLFASVQLTLFLLFALAATSIIGTIIPQNNPPGFYAQAYGEQTARFFQLLDLQDMYNSWWFLGLLGLFALNLIVCSLERIPQVVRMVRRNPLEMNVDQLRKMPLRQDLTLQGSLDETSVKMQNLLARHGWKFGQTDKDGGKLLAAQKGSLTRFGVYVVHCSILVILAGALVGSSTVAEKILHRPNFAFKGAMMLPEGQTTSQITTFKTNFPVDLGFQLRCDNFSIQFYDNGMPKTYRSQVSLLENNQVVRHATIEVNHPLTYKGVTFYQSSYHPYPVYRVTLQRQDDKAQSMTMIEPIQENIWQEAGVHYGIINQENQGEITKRVKFWFKDGKNAPVTEWLSVDQENTLKSGDSTFLVTIKQVYATGLQATKDPGVGLVYAGCILILMGLYVAFFTSHRRLWIFVREGKKQECQILFAGEANKNKVGFEKNFLELIKALGA